MFFSGFEAAMGVQQNTSGESKKVSNLKNKLNSDNWLKHMYSLGYFQLLNLHYII